MRGKNMTPEEYSQILDKQAQQYKDMMDRLMEKQDEQFRRLLDRGAEAPKNKEFKIRGNPSSTWITGEDGQPYLLMNRDCANLLYEVLEKTNSGLQEIASGA